MGLFNYHVSSSLSCCLRDWNSKLELKSGVLLGISLMGLLELLADGWYLAAISGIGLVLYSPSQVMSMSHFYGAKH